MARDIQLWHVERLRPYAKNPRTHSDAQVAQIAGSIRQFGFNAPILVDSSDGIIAGHGRFLAARQLQLTQVPVIVLDHLTESEKRAYIIADNKIAANAGWDDEALSMELAALEDAEFDLDPIGFSEEELRVLFAEVGQNIADAPAGEDEVKEPPANPITRPGDIWVIGKHHLICGDSRDAVIIAKLLGTKKVSVAITSPPYAAQREYDTTSGFKPIAPEEYVAWFRDVAKNIQGILAQDGSYFLNIKEHAEDGERTLYVKDLVLAHQRQWGWRFVDEFCWRKTDNGVPGGWNNRFKNAWEPVFHFCRQQEIKFRPLAVGHRSEDCFEYSPDNPASTSGSGLLGSGPRGTAAGSLRLGRNGMGGRKPAAIDSDEGRFTGIARPSNVIEVKTESSQGSHSAPFPRALVEFFLKAFSDPGDLVFDPFLGSGTTLAAAHVLGRTGYGCEISPAYCDVILHRISTLTREEPKLAASGASLAEVAAERGEGGL